MQVLSHHNAGVESAVRSTAANFGGSIFMTCSADGLRSWPEHKSHMDALAAQWAALTAVWGVPAIAAP